MPVAGLVSVGGMFLQRLFHEARGARSDVALIADYRAGAGIVLGLSQALARERNLSLIQLGAGATPAREAELKAALAATDQAAAAVLAWLDQLGRRTDAAQFAEGGKNYRENLTTVLAAVRADVAAHKLSVAGAMAGYTRVVFASMPVLESFRPGAANPDTLSFFDGIYTLNKMREQDSMLAGIFAVGTAGYGLQDDDLAIIRKQYFALAESETYVRRYFPALRAEFDRVLRTDAASNAYYKFLADLGAKLKPGDRLPPFAPAREGLPAFMLQRAAGYAATLEQGFSVALERLAADAGRKRTLTLAVAGGIGAGLVLSLLVNLAVMRGLRASVVGVSEAIGGASQDVHAAAEQLTGASEQISRNASNYAAALEEVSAALHDIAETARRNAAHGTDADRRAHEASGAVASGQAAVAELGLAMGSIRDSSKKITHIVSRINDLSFQTNILALNAAVEAARAGEAGAGFSVVAEEVRRLAQLCASAAAETSALIDESSASAERAADKSTHVTQAFASISRSVREVAASIGEIAKNHAQQSAGIQQVNEAVTRQEGVAQSTAAVAEETASAALSMKTQVDALAQSVATLDGIIGRRTAASPLAASAPATSTAGSRSANPFPPPTPKDTAAALSKRRGKPTLVS